MLEKKYPLVSIIVLNWNGKKFIHKFFESVEGLAYPANRLEVLFVDNASTDDSVEYFESNYKDRARLIQTGKNYGYSGGNNFGFHEAKGDYILVCNNDLELDKNCLDQLIKAAEKSDADIVVPKLVYADSKKINNAGSMLQTDKDWPNTERGMNMDVNDPEFNQFQEITAFCGACPLFRRSFLQSVGLFDKHFFLYWEDTDLSWRGQKAGKKYVYEPLAVAYHSASGSTGGENSPVFIYYVSRNRVLVLIKNGRPLLALRAFLKVFRDHIMYKFKDLLRALRVGGGRRPAYRNLLMGVKIIIGILSLTPLMLLKRWGIIKEETI